MNIANLHPWDVPADKARAIQTELAARVSQDDALTSPPRLIAGTDNSAPDADGYAWAAVVVVDITEFRVVEVQRHQAQVSLPYIPGLLSFREAPVLLGALARLTVEPDLIMVDGQGIAHPRRLGLASHVGLFVDKPTVGCAKSLLVGKHDALDAERGAWANIEHAGEVVGAAVRTRKNIKPVYVSTGHKVGLASAIEWVLASCTRYRLPEPTRLAHQAAGGQLAWQQPMS